MDDRARFKLAGRAVIAAGVLWIILAVLAVLVVLLVIRAVVHRNNLEVLIPVFAAAAIYGVWFLSTSLLARLLTNESKGYRPWRWGMIARTEAGKSAEQFDIPLTYS